MLQKQIDICPQIRQIKRNLGQDSKFQLRFCNTLGGVCYCFWIKVRLLTWNARSKAMWSLYVPAANFFLLKQDARFCDGCAGKTKGSL